MWMRHGDFIALFRAWKSLNSLLRDEWIWYWTFRPQFWVFHVVLVLWLCGNPLHNVQIPRAFRASTDGPVERCPGFSRVSREVSICNPRSDKQQICDLPKLCPRDVSWGIVWRISSVCHSNPARLDCEMRYSLSALFAPACYTSSRQAICYLTNTTDRITTVFQNVFDVPDRAL